MIPKSDTLVDNKRESSNGRGISFLEKKMLAFHMFSLFRKLVVDLSIETIFRRLTPTSFFLTILGIKSYLPMVFTNWKTISIVWHLW